MTRKNKPVPLDFGEEESGVSPLVVGAAVGVGSAALVAALLYAGRSKAAKKTASPVDAPETD